MNDEYEIFDNVDVSESENSNDSKKHADKKTVINSISLITMFLILIVCVVNLLVCLDLYSKYDDLKINPMVYFQNDGYINKTDTDNSIVVEDSGDAVIIETTTESKTVNNQIPSVGISSNTTNATSVVTSIGQTVTRVVADTTSISANPALININTATLEELTALSGIGEIKAQAIIDYRKENGSFTSVEDIINVSGIGEKTLEKIIDKITVG